MNKIRPGPKLIPNDKPAKIVGPKPTTSTAPTTLGKEEVFRSPCRSRRHSPNKASAVYKAVDVGAAQSHDLQDADGTEHSLGGRGKGVCGAQQVEAQILTDMETIEEDIFGREEGPTVPETVTRARSRLKLAKGKRHRESSPSKQMTLRHRK